MNHRFARHLQFLLMALDLTLINFIYFTAQIIFGEQLSVSSSIEYSYFGFFLSVAWIGIGAVIKLYEDKVIMSFESFTRRTFHSYLYFIAAVVVYLFFFHQFQLSRIFTFTILSGIAVSLLFNRFVYLSVYQYFRKKDFLIHKVMIIGYNSLAKRLVSYLESEGQNKKVIGYCEDPAKVDEVSLYPILSNVNNAMETCVQHGVTEIYSTIAPEHDRSIYQMIQVADQNCIRFRIIPDMGAFVQRKVHIDYLNEIPVISLRKEPLEELSNRIKKRIFDIVVSSFVLVFILSWLVPLIAILIKLESKGPVFFMQLRSGKDNKSFPCLKFRSMKVNSRANEMQATKNDARITKIGAFLRKTSLDEFPQFLNVLRGHMSIAGPRPHMLKHTDQYSQLIGQYMVRQFLKPGITGWAQVNGYRGETHEVGQMQNRVEHDLWYMENWNPWLDLKIVFLTAYNAIKGEEMAY